MDACSSRWSKTLPDTLYLQALDLMGTLCRHHPDREQISGHSFLLCVYLLIISFLAEDPIVGLAQNILVIKEVHLIPALHLLFAALPEFAGHCCLQRLAYQVCLLFSMCVSLTVSTIS